MEVQVLVQGPDTVHPIVVQVQDSEDPVRSFSDALSQGAQVLRVGGALFRMDTVLAVVVRTSFVEPGGRGGW
jgi:hypothetical protein